MFTSLRSVSSPLISTLLLLMGVGLMHTVVALDGELLGFSVTRIGTLTSAYYLGFLAGTWLVPRLTHRIGHIRTFGFGTGLVTVLVLLQAMVPNYWVWLGLRMVQGLMLVGLYAIIESWLNANTPSRHRSSVFAVYMMLNLGAGAMGQQFLHLTSDAWMLFVIVAMLFSAAGLPVSATRLPQPEIHSVPRIQVRRFHRLVPTAIISSLISGLVLGAVWGLLPVYANASGMSVTQVGIYVGVAVGGGVALQLPLGRFADRIDRRLALAVISGAGALLALAALALPDAWSPAALALVFGFGGMSFALYPIAVAHLVDYLERDDLLSASATVLLVNGLGSAVGPLIAGALMSRGQPWVLFLWFAGLSGVLAIYALLRYGSRKREVTPEDSFKPMVHTTPSAMDLHGEGTPRAGAEEAPGDAAQSSAGSA